jgi:hypothetical protein
MRTAAKRRLMTDQPFIDGVQFGMHTMSRERVTQLARDLLEAMTRTKAVTLLKDREVVRQAIAHALADELKREEEREEAVRRRISSMRKKPAQNSREYEELFRKLMEEEYLREGLDT